MNSPSSDQTLYIHKRNEWRRWLAENFESKPEIWLVYPKVATGKPILPYNDAVEEALCFGWIDSIRKALDNHHSIQRFTPRRKGSGFSQPNIERLTWLRKEGLLHPSVKDVVDEVLSRPFQFPEDIIDLIKEDPVAWENYKGFSPGYQRIRIAFIDYARKRPDEFEKRLKNFLEKTRKNELIKGFGGIEKYY